MQPSSLMYIGFFLIFQVFDVGWYFRIYNIHTYRHIFFKNLILNKKKRITKKDRRLKNKLRMFGITEGWKGFSSHLKFTTVFREFDILNNI